MLGVLIWAAAASASDPIIVPAPISGEGCVSQPGDTCTYTATRTGGYAANGSNWSLVVSIPTTVGDPRDVNADGKLTYTISPTTPGEVGCGLYPAGATATTSAGANSGIAAGNPFPAPSDSVRNNDCAGGVLPNRTDMTPQ
jgi:hypothetical protein